METYNKSPRISVCVASYNHAAFLGEMLESVLAQTFGDFEVIVVDDGSTDDSLDILRSYSERDARIRVYTHENNENRGISATANLAIEKSSGEFISNIGSDDLWYPHALQAQLDLMESDESLGIIYGKASRIDTRGRDLPGFAGEALNPDVPALDQIVRGNCVAAITSMFRKSALEKVGLYDEKVVYSDWELTIRILEHFNIAFIDDFLGKYRIHAKNTSVNIDTNRQYDYQRQVFLSLIEKHRNGKVKIPLKLLKEGLKSVEHRYSVEFFDEFIISARAGNSEVALSKLKDSFLSRPANFLNPKKIFVLNKYLLKMLTSDSNRKKADAGSAE